MTVVDHPAQKTEARRNWMALLAQADRTTIEAAYDALADKPAYTLLRPAEPGMVMVRGRAGGIGAPFNMGEMTVTRCTVTTEDGVTGTAYIAGTDRRKAELAAIMDALMQSPTHNEIINKTLIAPLAQARIQARRADREKVAATKVDFFTMVRGS